MVIETARTTIVHLLPTELSYPITNRSRPKLRALDVAVLLCVSSKMLGVREFAI